jgi:hypothetical protein
MRLGAWILGMGIHRSTCSADPVPCARPGEDGMLWREGVSIGPLRHSKVRKGSKTHTHWRLVRSVRRNGKVVQETGAQLGELDAEGRAKAKALARPITRRGNQRELFEPAELDDAPTPPCV